MCFSEHASFGASAVLVLIGVGCLRLVKNKPPFYALAAIPLFFALQQASEGVQWLHFKNIWGSIEVAAFAKYTFLFFAFSFWPAWIPLSLTLAEKDPGKKRSLWILSLAGILFAIYNGWQIFAKGATASPGSNSILYDTPITIQNLWPYMILVYLPWFLSSLPRMRLVGAAFIATSLIAGYFYEVQFISVWCFFAAIISSLLLYALNSLKS